MMISPGLEDSQQQPIAPSAPSAATTRVAEEILELRRQGRGWAAIKRALGAALPDGPLDEPPPVAAST